MDRVIKAIVYVVSYTGMIISIIGMSAMDSESQVLPAIMSVSGMLILFVMYKLYWKEEMEAEERQREIYERRHGKRRSSGKHTPR